MTQEEKAKAQQFTPYTRWITQHAEKIKAEYPDRPTEEMAQEMNVNYYTLSRRATSLGVGKSAKFMHTSWKKGARKKGGWKKRTERAKLIETVDKYMQEYFADTKNEELARFFGVDVKTVRRWARRLGLLKSEAFMQKARGRGGRKNYYTPEQITYRNRRIAEVYPDGDKEALQRLSEELGINRRYIKYLAGRIGVHRNHRPPRYLDELAAYFPTHTDKECAARFGITRPQVQGIARKYGWKKTIEHLRRIRANRKRPESPSATD